MLSKHITVCIFAWNEERRILRCIDNFKGLFDIIVVDNFSTDRTVEIVKEAGYKSIIVKNPGFIETPEVMDPVCNASSTDYVLIASVSEFIPLPLLQKYADVANRATHDVVCAYRNSITAGESIPISDRPTKRFPGELRFFKKGMVDYRNNEVHGRGRIICPPSRILNVVTDPHLHFFQFRDYDWSHTEFKHRVYNDILAKQRFDKGVRFSWFWMNMQATKQFLNAYVRFGCWRYGVLGFIHSFHRWYMEIGIWFRIWEWENQLSRSGVMEKNDAFRRKLEQEVSQFIDKVQ